MVDRNEKAHDDYPLPVVTPQAVAEAMRYLRGDSDAEHERALDTAFAFAQAHNTQMVNEIGDMLAFSGYNDPESRTAAKTTLAVVHTLLHAQARINQGLPGVDMTSDEYFLPVVTEDAITAMLAGADERARARSMTTYEEFDSSNHWAADTVKLLGYPIGHDSPLLPTQAAEITAVATHAMLREQSAIDILERGLGGGPLG